MEHPDYGERYRGSAAENYERYFVPAIGRPSAAGLIEAAKLRPGEEVLDVACGTGVVSRLAREAVGPEGAVTGLDVNPGMIAVARASTPAEMDIAWVEAPAEDMPLSDDSFDVALCGMGLQFFEDRVAGLREMRRVLRDDGRAVLNLPGPIRPVFEVFERGLARHVGPEAAGFAAAVFSLHDPDEIRELAERAGFSDVRIDSTVGVLAVPPPEDFFRQYVHSTPLGAVVAGIDADRRATLAREVCDGWRDFVEDGKLRLEVRMTTVVLEREAPPLETRRP
ncbi:MAG: methyltransferase domain-containing protein [Gemmatimonadota bacterium]